VKNPTPTAPGERVLTVVEGSNGQKEERWLSADDARAEGYTLVDLADDWTPYLFEELTGPEGQPLPNRYRRVFIGLANDQLDGDGVPLEPGKKNYLELYGIFPSLSVLRQRFLEDADKPCLDPEQRAALQSVKSLSWSAPRAATLTGTEAWSIRRRVIAAAERRLICEGALSDPSLTRDRVKHVLGTLDEPLSRALRRFQQKHMIYDAQALLPNTLSALARTSLENDQAAFMRAFRERVVAATGVIEDGSTDSKTGPLLYTTRSGERVPLRNLADEYTAAAAAQLGLGTPESTLAFFERHPLGEFGRLKAGVKLAPRPEYYGPNMELSIVVDRGDVYYDPPFDEKDTFHVQKRQRYPELTLNLEYYGQLLPLARWRTTIGGWRREQASNGYDYYRYKGSDTGPRVLRKIVSGPVWIAPESTPIGGLVAGKTVQGRWQSGINYDELGPGYLSAYGVVAGYFVIPGVGGAPDQDGGIRAHGSSDYLSIYSERGYSHGCHRLPNHIAIRLYDFLLQHRTTIIKGDTPINFARQFLWQDQVYELRIPSPGFEFQLDPPILVNVLEGSIKGTLQEPVEGLVPIPGKRYPPPPADEPDPDSLSSESGGEPSRGEALRGAP
jgi:hypothetical protein